MKAPSLKTGILTVGAIGVLGILYVISSALVSSTHGPLDSYAVGAMSKFRTVPEAPEQPRNTLITGEGEEITLADKRGKIVLVNFWATWCAPCVVEMPYLNDLQGAYGSDNFEVVTISMDRRIEEPQAFFEEHELDHLNFYFDPGMSIAFGVMGSANRGLPLTILYDRNGIEIGRVAGEAEWNSPEAYALIEAALERY
jgi:thiol-disulfide isomerase/thioredoxin